MQWFRSYHGAPFDTKLALVARHAGVTHGHAASLWWAVLDHASQHQDRGSVEGIDHEVLAAAFGYEPDDVSRVLDAMRENERLINKQNRVTNWDKRQVKREDSTAAERQRHARSRNVTHKSRKVTQGRKKSRLDKRRIDKKDIDSSFTTFWAAVPKKVGKGDARKAYIEALKKVDADTILAGIKRYALEVKDEEPKFIKHPGPWLRAERWDDEGGGRSNGGDNVEAYIASHRLGNWPRRMKDWRATDGVAWRSEWGPKPGEEGCRVPAELLDG